MKKFCQYIGINISIIGNFCNLAVNFAGFRKCLAEHTVHYLVTLLGIAYHIGVIEQCCQTV